MIARALHGLDDVRAYLSNKTSLPKIKLMQFFGIDMYVSFTQRQIYTQLTLIVLCLVAPLNPNH